MASGLHSQVKLMSSVIRSIVSVADPSGGGGGGWGAVTPLLEFFFNKSKVYEQKISIKWVRKLSQIAGSGHFRDSNFQKFLGEHAPRHPTRKLLLVMPPPLCVSRSHPCCIRSYLLDYLFIFTIFSFGIPPFSEHY